MDTQAKYRNFRVRVYGLIRSLNLDNENLIILRLKEISEIIIDLQKQYGKDFKLKEEMLR